MLEFRKAIEEDFPELKDTLKESFIQASIDDFGNNKMLPPGVLDGEMITKAFDEKTLFTLRWNNKLVGGIIVELKDSKDNYLQAIWITTRYHNKGIGKKAISLLEKEYPNTISWNLETPQASKRNIRFYENLGYKKVGEQSFMEGKLILLNYKKTM